MTRIILALLALVGLAAAAPAQEAWPTRPITLVVPYAAGTAPDTIARVLGEQLSARLGQPVVVDNRTGAGGLIGTDVAAHAPKDGYALFLGSLDTQALLGPLYHPKFDPVTAFAPISLLGRIYNVIAAGPPAKINSIQQLLEEGKKGRSFTYATPGVGTNLHLLGELMKARTGINLVHVPYRVASGGYTDAMAGRVDLVIAGVPPVAALIKDKKLTALVTTAPQKIDALPDTPTMADIGYKDLTVVGWFGLLAPAGTSPAIVDKLNAAVKAITQDAAYRKRMQDIHIDPASTSPAEFADIIKSEAARFGKIIEKAHITVN